MANNSNIKNETEWKKPRSGKIVVLGYLGQIIENKENSYELIDDDKGMLPIELQNSKNGEVIIKAYDNENEIDRD